MTADGVEKLEVDSPDDGDCRWHSLKRDGETVATVKFRDHAHRFAASGLLVEVVTDVLRHLASGSGGGLDQDYLIMNCEAALAAARVPENSE